MASLTLNELRDGERVFIDSTIFIYHFTGVSSQCRALLERCENNRLKGVSSTVVMAEVAHRLMMIEAVERKLVSGGNVAKKLRGKPEVVRELQVYQQQVERIPLIGIQIESLDLRVVLSSEKVRGKYGLLVNDSIIAATAMTAGIRALATADADFQKVSELDCFLPADLV
jgi:predicted nucleic acid-binding protein